MPEAKVDIFACSHPPDEWPLSKLKLKLEEWKSTEMAKNYTDEHGISIEIGDSMAFEYWRNATGYWCILYVPEYTVWFSGVDEVFDYAPCAKWQEDIAKEMFLSFYKFIDEDYEFSFGVDFHYFSYLTIG